MIEEHMVKLYREGDGSAVVYLLSTLVEQGHPDIPDDVQERIEQGLTDYLTGKQKSLDVALGVETSHQAMARRKQVSTGMGLFALHGIIKGRLKPGEDWFEAAGRMLKVSPGQAKKCYYAFRKLIGK